MNSKSPTHSLYSRLSFFLLISAVICLIGLGLVMLMSTSPWAEPDHMSFTHVKKQAIFLGIGLVAAFIAGVTPLSFLEKYWWVLFGGSCLLLALCYLPSVGVSVNGSKRWIKFPVLGQFQPSEAAKVAVTIFLAMWMARQQANPSHFLKGYLIPLIILAIPAGLIFFEKDMGTTAVLIGSALLVLYVGGARPWLILGTFILGILLLGGFIYFDKEVLGNENRFWRLMSFTDLEGTKQEFGYQQWRGLLAFYSGGLEGVGLGNGAEKHGYLPFAHTDFIYPIVGEELGLRGSLGVIITFTLIAFSGIFIASTSNSRFASLLAVGLTANIVTPAIVNMGVTTAVLPNTGLPLPFVSYGGTNLIFTLVSVGIIVGIYFRSPKENTVSITLKRKRQILRL